MSTIYSQINTAFDFYHAGDYKSATVLAKDVLSIAPDQPYAIYLLGMISYQEGRHEEAQALLKRSIELKPDESTFHNFAGIILITLKLPTLAIKEFETAINLAPDNIEPYIHLALIYKRMGNSKNAISVYHTALGKSPDNPVLHFNLANALQETGNLEEAIYHYNHALSVNNNYLEAHINIASAYNIFGKNELAILHLERALVIKPDFAEVHNNLGNVYLARGLLTKAKECFNNALTIKPDYADAYAGLGIAQQSAGKLPEAVTSYKKSIDLHPYNTVAHSNLLFILNYLNDSDPESIYKEHLKFGHLHETPLLKARQPHDNDRNPGRRLRIGYVSPDFRDHSVAYFIEPVLAHHHHNQFEIFCYYNYAVEDQVTQRLKSLADHWRSIVGLSDDQAAQLIRKDKIDILVDLAGHTANNRLLVFARKPAPIQVTWLGYLNTTGLNAMDYRITDRWANPSGMTDHYHTETLVRLPDSQWCYQPPARTPPVSSLPALDNAYITFASLHNLAKVTPEVIELWSRLLLAIPGARLLIAARGLEHLQSEILARFAGQGVEAGQLDLRGALSFDDYLALHQTIDINLDTFPYTGGTTTCHSLWMGVPVITLGGKTATSRGGASLLNALGLSDLVAESQSEYISIAKQLANQTSKLATLRSTLRERMLNSPLIGATQFTTNLEAIYRNMLKDKDILNTTTD